MSQTCKSCGRGDQSPLLTTCLYCDELLKKSKRNIWGLIGVVTLILIGGAYYFTHPDRDWELVSECDSLGDCPPIHSFGIAMDACDRGHLKGCELVYKSIVPDTTAILRQIVDTWKVLHEAPNEQAASDIEDLIRRVTSFDSVMLDSAEKGCRLNPDICLIYAAARELPAERRRMFRSMIEGMREKYGDSPPPLIESVLTYLRRGL